MFSFWCWSHGTKGDLRSLHSYLFRFISFILYDVQKYIEKRALMNYLTCDRVSGYCISNFVYVHLMEKWFWNAINYYYYNFVSIKWNRSRKNIIIILILYILNSLATYFMLTNFVQWIAFNYQLKRIVNNNRSDYYNCQWLQTWNYFNRNNSKSTQNITVRSFPSPFPSHFFLLRQPQTQQKREKTIPKCLFLEHNFFHH